MFLRLQPILLTIERWVVPGQLRHFATIMEPENSRQDTYVTAVAMVSLIALVMS